MKTIVCMMMVMLCCWTSGAFADEWEGLTLQAREYVELQTRTMEGVGIPEEPARQMLTLMIQNRFEKQNVVQAQQMVMAAARAGLPTGPMMSKALEGMAKQVPEMQIIAAMEKVRNRYQYAQQTAKSLVTEKKNIDAATLAVADSLAAGMESEDIDKIKAQLQSRVQTQTQARTRTRTRTEDETLAVQTMLTVRTMARLGIDSSEVTDTVNQALGKENTAREVSQLRERLATHHVEESPAAIAGSHAVSTGKGDDAGQGSGSDNGSANGGADSGNSGSGSASGGAGSGSSGNAGGGSGNGGSGSGNSGSGSDNGGAGSGSSGSAGGGSGDGGSDGGNAGGGNGAGSNR